MERIALSRPDSSSPDDITSDTHITLVNPPPSRDFATGSRVAGGLSQLDGRVPARVAPTRSAKIKAGGPRWSETTPERPCSRADMQWRKADVTRRLVLPLELEGGGDQPLCDHSRGASASQSRDDERQPGATEDRPIVAGEPAEGRRLIGYRERVINRKLKRKCDELLDKRPIAGDLRVRSRRLDEHCSACGLSTFDDARCVDMCAVEGCESDYYVTVFGSHVMYSARPEEVSGRCSENRRLLWRTVRPR